MNKLGRQALSSLREKTRCSRYGLNSLHRNSILFSSSSSFLSSSSTLCVSSAPCASSKKKSVSSKCIVNESIISMKRIHLSNNAKELLRIKKKSIANHNDIFQNVRIRSNCLGENFERNGKICGKRMMSSTTNIEGKPVDAYHAGLQRTEFTTDISINKDSPVIPIFRVLGYDGNLLGDWSAPFSDDEVVESYMFMVRLNVWDSLFYNVQRQGRISFYMQNQGEEAVQTGIGKALKPDDHIFGQYRELGVLLLHGMTIDDVINQLFSLKGDESKGRQMPISYSKRSSNIHTVCTPLTTQVPHAAGAGYAFKNAGEKKIAVVFFGDGAASEGDFHAAMNCAAVMKSQTIFVCRNNGYAISTPVKEQYAGDGIAIRGIAYGMETVRVDGNDFFATYIAFKKARELSIETSQPVCMEFMTYRVGHHSTSDDSTQYRPAGELSSWTATGINPIHRVRNYLKNKKLWTDKDEELLQKDARNFILEKVKAAQKLKKYDIISGMFDDVYDKEPWNIKEQRNELRNHLHKYKDIYDVSSYDCHEKL